MASSTTFGSEVEAVATVNDKISIQFTGTMQDPRLVDLAIQSVDQETAQTSVLQLSGKQVRRIPKILFNIRPSYKMNHVKLFADLQYVSKRYADDANTAALQSYSMLSAGFISDTPFDNLSISGNIANITNTIGLTEGNPRVEQVYANRSETIFMARPILGRSILMAATYEF